MIRLTALIILLILPCALHSAQPLKYRVWQLQDYEMEHMKRLIHMASQRNVNRVQLSHHIVMDVEEVLENPARARDVDIISRFADHYGIDCDIWTHELEGITDEMLEDGKINIDAPGFWEFVQDKYRRLFEMCPSLDGLVITLHETQIKLWDDRVQSAMSPPERITKLVDALDEVCRPLGKRLFVRTFAYEPVQLEYIIDGLRAAEADVVAMSKAVPHDWQPYYPHNPAIGRFEPKEQVVEFDLGYEFLGLSRIPYIDIPWLEDRLEYALSQGADGAVLRVERLKWRVVDSPNQANVDVFTQMLSEPSRDGDELFRGWLAKNYGQAAVEDLFSAFARTFDVVNKSYFVLGFWVTNHSVLPDFGYAEKSLYGRTTAKWDESYRQTEQELFEPTLDTLEKIRAEKRDALRLLERSLGDVRQAREHLRPAQYDELVKYFQREKATVQVWTPALETFFAIRVYRRYPSPEARDHLLYAARRLERAVEEHREELKAMLATYDDAAPERNISNALGLVQMARETAGASGSK